MSDNYQLVTRGFQLITEMLAPYVCQQIQAKFGQHWWRDGVLAILNDAQRRDLPYTGSWTELVDSLDTARCLLLIDLHWNAIFKLRLSREQRTWVKELMNTRNRWAHKGSGDFSDEDAWRALDTMARLMEQIDSEVTEQLRELARQVRYGTTGASTERGKAKPEPLPSAASSNTIDVLSAPPRPGLPPWRLVVEPHPDVAQGRYRQAEFAADLSQVLRGTASVEYQDPVEFFGRTYITEGMKGLLVQVAQRLAGQGGEPVIQLKTAFGGGKTHSMLALYHLFRGQAPINRIDSVNQLLKQAGVSTIPKAKVAVLVGTALNPTKVRKPPTFPGISIRTLWGELAAQLAEQAGNPRLYDIVRDADKTSVPPGSDTLQELLDSCGPCLILIDELVAYARKLYGVPNLVAGSFDAFQSFVQELTEAVIKSRNSCVVASVPESDIELGGEAGRLAAEKIEKVFGRVEGLWKPVGADEGFEIVRRRLFLPVHDPSAVDDVCRSFSEMYREGGSDFPIEAKELAYLEKMKSCYPIHPEVFDRLYNDWATLEHFQKTRGVLRLMASVIHDLWIRQDASLMIMPSSIPLDNNVVREELTRYLSEGWSAVIERDIDGPRSLPYSIDAHNPRFGRCMAARRVARTIFLGSAPSVKEQRVRGIEDVRVRLGTVQPGEQVAVFNDALGRMQDTLTHLYSANQRYWYDLPPNLRRTVEDRAQQFSDDDVELEIERRLKASRERADFAGVHPCPTSSLDVPDDQKVRLVLLGLKNTHRHADKASTAISAAEDILNNRGASPRMYRNMLAFVAPDRDLVGSLKSEVRRYLAWKSVVKDAEEEALNLDAFQRRQAKEGLERSDETVDLQIKEVYCWLLVPTQDGSNPVTWEVTRISGGTENCIVKAAQKMRSSEQLIIKWSPALLRMELDNWLWKDQDHIQIRALWNYLSSYCYLSRLRDEKVLLDAIRAGLNSREFFGYAQGVNNEGRFLGLKLGTQCEVDMSSFLVKPEAAEKQIAADQAAKKPEYTIVSGPGAGVKEIDDGTRGAYGQKQQDEPQKPSHPAPSLPRRFYGTVKLDPTRVGRDAGRIAEEVVQHLTSLAGAKVEVVLEIHAHIPGGISQDVQRTINENCTTLKFKSQGFEEE